MASKKNGTIYVGITSDLEKRISEHKAKILEGFTQKYDVSKLVYFEDTCNVEAAIEREKQIKKWNRAWKLKLIEKSNPNWTDLSEEWFKIDLGVTLNFTLATLGVIPAQAGIQKGLTQTLFFNS